ncbi:MAG: glycosyltransferase family 39 protein, partial [Acidobacteria bacterium]|nr:glycosyltransferase family 39 protein [Acidobacteriota bacterium]
MNALLALLALALVVSISLLIPGEGPAAVLFCTCLAALIGLTVSRYETHGQFLVQVFAAALLLRMTIGTIIYLLNLQEFFGGDALTYDIIGETLIVYWRGHMTYAEYEMALGAFMTRNWGMGYLVAAIYAVMGRNMLAVQFFNAVVGAATAPVIFLCARHIFQNLRVARLATFFVAFFPSLVLWSAQGLKDGPIIFLLSV